MVISILLGWKKICHTSKYMYISYTCTFRLIGNGWDIETILISSVLLHKIFAITREYYYIVIAPYLTSKPGVRVVEILPVVQDEKER